MKEKWEKNEEKDGKKMGKKDRKRIKDGLKY